MFSFIVIVIIIIVIIIIIIIIIIDIYMFDELGVFWFRNSFQFLFFNDLSCYGPFATDNSLSRALILSLFHKL